MSRTMKLGEKIKLILIWADESGTDFDPSFVEKMEKEYEEKKSLSAKQEAAIENIYERWKVEEWADENGYL